MACKDALLVLAAASLQLLVSIFSICGRGIQNATHWSEVEQNHFGL